LIYERNNPAARCRQRYFVTLCRLYLPARFYHVGEYARRNVFCLQSGRFGLRRGEMDLVVVRPVRIVMGGMVVPVAFKMCVIVFRRMVALPVFVTATNGNNSNCDEKAYNIFFHFYVIELIINVFFENVFPKVE
jgi:hypothetical protein